MLKEPKRIRVSGQHGNQRSSKLFPAKSNPLGPHLSLNCVRITVRR